MTSGSRSSSLGLVVLALAASTLLALGCGGGGGGGGMVQGAQISCGAGFAPAANNVAMVCGGATDATTEQVDVEVAGPVAGSITVRGFNFDVTYDPGFLEFVSASDASPLFPGALVAVTLYNGQQGRVIVSVQQPGGAPDVSVGAGEHTLIGLSFRRVTGTTFGPTPLTFENAEATNASAAIGFSSNLTLAYQ